MNAQSRPPGLEEALERLASMPEFLEAALARGGNARLPVRPAAGGFSLVEHACHLRDLEREGYLLRVRRLLAEPKPVLQGFEGDRIAAERDYLAQDAAEAASGFASARAELLRLVRGLDAAALAHEGEFAGAPVTVAGIVAMAAAHDAEHRADIDRLLAELG